MGSALPELHCPLPPGSKAVYCRSSTVHCPQVGVPLFRQRPPPGKDSASPQLVGRRLAGVPLPTAPRRCGSALQALHRPLPPGSLAVRCRSSTAHRPRAVRQCIAGVPLPAAPSAVRQGTTRIPLFRQRPPPGQDSPSPQLVGQRTAGVPLPTAPRRCGGALQEFHYLLPPGSAAPRCTSSTAHRP